MAPGLTIVIPVWDEHTRLLPRCLQAIRNEQIVADLILVDNASDLPFEIPPGARRVTLTQRQSMALAAVLTAKNASAAAEVGAHHTGTVHVPSPPPRASLAARKRALSPA